MNLFKRKSFYLALIFVGLVTASIVTFFAYKNKMNNNFLNELNSQSVDYVIPNVPYVGMHNHVGALSYATGRSNNDSTAGVTSILEYWYPNETNFSEVRHSLVAPLKSNRYVGAENVRSLFNQLGKYNVTVVRLKASELGKYINESARTPLLFNTPIDTEQPETITLHPMRVVIGVKNSEKKIVVHDYYLGNNYEISFDDLDKMWERKRPDQRNEFIVVQPIDFNNKIKEVKSRQEISYSPRTSVMIEGEDMFSSYVKGLGAYSLKQMDVAMQYFGKIEQNPKFNDYFPNLFRVMIYQRMAQIYLIQKDFNKALDYINKAIALNHDLDKPFKDWSGYEIRDNRPDVIDRYASPLRVLGDINYQMGELGKAKENYQKALDISPSDPYAMDGMKKVEISGFTKNVE